VDPLRVGEPVHRYPQLWEGLLDDPRLACLVPFDEHRAVRDAARQHAHHGLFILADTAGRLKVTDQRPGLLYVQKLCTHDNHNLSRSDAPRLDEIDGPASAGATAQYRETGDLQPVSIIRLVIPMVFPQ
jgi:hypothetical protein